MRVTAPTVGLRRARDAAERSAAAELRIRVFCDEQGVSRQEEIDGRDDDAVHLVAIERGAVVGTCRIVLNAQTRARGLYRAAGYTEHGGRFMEAGIEHVRMELPLA